jgi:hypothetical protein
MRDARLRPVCKAAVRKAGRETMRALSRAWADAAVLEFSGSTSIFVPRGLWTGSFNKTLTQMPGAWHANDFAPH